MGRSVPIGSIHPTGRLEVRTGPVPACYGRDPSARPGERQCRSMKVGSPLSWTSAPTPSADDLHNLREFVSGHIEAARVWYERRGRSRRMAATSLRTAAFVAICLAVLLPIIAAIWPSTLEAPLLMKAGPIGLASLCGSLVGVAATVFALDHFFGFSTGSYRYSLAAIRLQTISTRFESNWPKRALP